MAILVGVLAPNLLRYIERANRASDTQLADTIRTAMITSLLDPNAETYMTGHGTHYIFIDSTSGVNSLFLDGSGAENSFAATFAETLGYPDAATMCEPKGLISQLRSKDVTEDSQIVLVIRGNNVWSYITYDWTTIDICVPNCSWDASSTYTHNHLIK